MRVVRAPRPERRGQDDHDQDGERGLYDRLSGYDNQRYGELYGVPPRELRCRVHDLLDDVGLTDRAGERVERYSRGGLPVFQMLFFVYLGRTSGLRDDTFFVIGNAIQGAGVAGSLFLLAVGALLFAFDPSPRVVAGLPAIMLLAAASCTAIGLLLGAIGLRARDVLAIYVTTALASAARVRARRPHERDARPRLT